MGKHNAIQDLVLITDLGLRIDALKNLYYRWFKRAVNGKAIHQIRSFQLKWINYDLQLRLYGSAARSPFVDLVVEARHWAQHVSRGDQGADKEVFSKSYLMDSSNDGVAGRKCGCVACLLFINPASLCAFVDTTHRIIDEGDTVNHVGQS